MRAGSTKYEYVYETLRQRIQHGNLQPGDRLQVRAIAEEMSTSDIPVREALSRLSAEGLVVYRPHQGGVVLNLAPGELREIMVLKAILEAAATRLSAPHVTPALLKHLEQLVQSGEALEAGSDPVAYVQNNRDFHTAVYSLGPTPPLVAAIEAQYSKLNSQRKATIFSFFPDRVVESCREHRQLIELFRQTPQDLDRIEALTRWHKLQNVARLAMPGSRQLCNDLLQTMEFDQQK